MASSLLQLSEVLLVLTMRESKVDLKLQQVIYFLASVLLFFPQLFGSQGHVPDKIQPQSCLVIILKIMIPTRSPTAKSYVAFSAVRRVI